MSGDSDPRNLIINYIPTPVTSAELRHLFERFGQVESARIIVDRASNHPKGYGFVKFKTEESAHAAILDMNGYEIYNKRLRVSPARGPQNAQSGGGGGGGGGDPLRASLLSDGPGLSTASTPPPPPPLRGHPQPSFPLVPALPAPLASAGAFAIVDGVPVQVLQAANPQIVAAAQPPPPPPVAIQQNFSQMTNGVNAPSGPLLATQVLNSSKVPLQLMQQQQQPPYGMMLQPMFVQSVNPMAQMIDPAAHSNLPLSFNGDPQSVSAGFSLNPVLSRTESGEVTGMAC